MKSNKLGYLYLINTILLFSSYEVVSKSIVHLVNPFQINFIRFLVGGLFLFACGLYKKDIKLNKEYFFIIWLIGVLNVLLSMNFLQLSLAVPNSMASVVAVIFSSNPVFVTIFDAFINKEKIKKKNIFGLLVGVAGILIISFDKFDVKSFNLVSPMLALISAVLYGLYTVLGRKASIQVGSLKMNTYSFILGSLSLLPFLIVFNQPIVHFRSEAIFQVIYLSLFVTGISYLTYFKGLNSVGVSKGSYVFFLKPVLASILAVMFLKEQLTANLVIGTLVVMGSLFLVTKKSKAVVSNE